MASEAMTPRADPASPAPTRGGHLPCLQLHLAVSTRATNPSRAAVSCICDHKRTHSCTHGWPERATAAKERAHEVTGTHRKADVHLQPAGSRGRYSAGSGGAGGLVPRASMTTCSNWRLSFDFPDPAYPAHEDIADVRRVPVGHRPLGAGPAPSRPALPARASPHSYLRTVRRALCDRPAASGARRRLRQERRWPCERMRVPGRLCQSFDRDLVATQRHQRRPARGCGRARSRTCRRESGPRRARPQGHAPGSRPGHRAALQPAPCGRVGERP